MLIVSLIFLLLFVRGEATRDSLLNPPSPTFPSCLLFLFSFYISILPVFDMRDGSLLTNHPLKPSLLLYPNASYLGSLLHIPHLSSTNLFFIKGIVASLSSSHFLLPISIMFLQKSSSFSCSCQTMATTFFHHLPPFRPSFPYLSSIGNKDIQS